MDTAARIKIGVVLALLALVTIVVLQNSFPVIVRVLFWSASVDLLLLLLGLFVVGLLAGMLLFWVFRPGRRSGVLGDGDGGQGLRNNQHSG